MGIVIFRAIIKRQMNSHANRTGNENDLEKAVKEGEIGISSRTNRNKK